MSRSLAHSIVYQCVYPSRIGPPHADAAFGLEAAIRVRLVKHGGIGADDRRDAPFTVFAAAAAAATGHVLLGRGRGHHGYASAAPSAAEPATTVAATLDTTAAAGCSPATTAGLFPATAFTGASICASPSCKPICASPSCEPSRTHGPKAQLLWEPAAATTTTTAATTPVFPCSCP